MKKAIIISFSAIVLIIVGYFIYTTQSAESTSKKVVRIGAVLPLSGDVASYGIDSRNGINLAIDIANESQNEYVFEVEYQDSKGDPSTAATALQQVLSIYDPIVVIGENISSSTGAMIPIANRNQILLISPSASATNLSGLSKYFFRLFPTDDNEATFIAETISNQHPNGNVNIIFVNNDYGVGLRDTFTKKAEDFGLSISGEFGFNPDLRDFRSILARVKNNKPDAIYMPSYYEDGGALVRQIREMNIQADLYGSTTHEDPKFIEIAGEASEGFQYPVSTGYDPNSNDSVVVNFINTYNQVHSEDPGLVTALGYDSAKLIIDGVINNGNSGTSIRDYILNTPEIVGASGTMTFDENGDVYKPIVLKTIENGQFIPKSND